MEEMCGQGVWEGALSLGALSRPAILPRSPGVQQSGSSVHRAFWVFMEASLLIKSLAVDSCGVEETKSSSLLITWSAPLTTSPILRGFPKVRSLTNSAGVERALL